jgi:hypothetical protein
MKKNEKKQRLYQQKREKDLFLSLGGDLLCDFCACALKNLAMPIFGSAGLFFDDVFQSCVTQQTTATCLRFVGFH